MSRRSVSTRIARMTGQAVLIVALDVVLVFALVRVIPGDPAKVILGNQYTPEAGAALRQELHLDEPVVAQFGLYVRGLLHGDLGRSTSQGGRAVADILAAALPTTAAVVFTGILFGVLAGVLLGLLAATSRRKGVDLAVRTATTVTFSAPTFLVALLLILFFALDLRWLPAGGWPGQWPQNIRYLILPGIALAATMSTLVTRTVRQAALDVQRQQFMESAFMRGLSGRALVFRHLLPNSFLPVLTLIGISVGTLVTGAIIVESVFNLPGLGEELGRAVAQRDYPIIQGVALVTSLIVVLSGYLVEVLYAFVDPRARVA